MSEVKYFDLGIFPYIYGFTDSVKAYKAELKRRNIADASDFLARPDVGASTHFFSSDSGEAIAIVTLRKTWKQMDRNQVSALVTHECVHVWQDVKRHIGEVTPGHETEAYAIQRMVQNILYELYPE